MQLRVHTAIHQNETFIPVAGNRNTSLLKILALIFMIIDHTGATFFPPITEMRIIGRLAFPLYVWCTVVGIEYTRNHWKYAFRVLLSGIVSQPFYMLGLGHRLYEMNIMFTLLLGILGMIAIREHKWHSEIWGPVLAVFTAFVIKTDYGWRGVLLILLMYAARKNRGALLAVFFAFCLYWGADSSSLSSAFGLPLNWASPYIPYGRTFLKSINRLQFTAFYAAPLILLNIPCKIKFPKWLAYAAYPGHLAIIALIRFLLQH